MISIYIKIGHTNTLNIQTKRLLLEKQSKLNFRQTDRQNKQNKVSNSIVPDTTLPSPEIPLSGSQMVIQDVGEVGHPHT